jgi:hypothetical protein
MCRGPSLISLRFVLASLLCGSACLPSATVAPTEPVAEAEPEVAPTPTPPRHARMTGTIVLHADPRVSDDRLVLIQGQGTSSERIVELLEVRDGWWRVRTLLPREVMALGLDAGMGVAVLSLEGWVEAAHVVEVAPGSAIASVPPSASATPAAVPPDSILMQFAVRAGTKVLWPDGRVAGEVVEDHYFHFPATGRMRESPDGLITVWCHERREAPGLGVVQGWLCSSEQDAKDAKSVDKRVAVALDQPGPQPDVGGSKVEGALDKDIIRRIVRAHLNEVRSCYNAGLQKDPALTGRVSINFVIKGDGAVGSAVIADDNLPDPEVGKCIAKAVQTWRFPKPLGGGNVVVTYPFTLVPG